MNREIDIDLLIPGQFQPRQDAASFNVEGLKRMANTIRKIGVLQAPLVRPKGREFEIVLGERRWRAAQLAGLRQIEVTIREMSDDEAISAAVIENAHRENLNVMERAMSALRLVEEFQHTHEEIAELLGEPRSTISLLIGLTTLESEIQQWVRTGELTYSHAKVLIGRAPLLQRSLGRQAIQKRLSVRKLERLVVLNEGGAGKGNKTAEQEDSDLKRLAGQIGESLHCDCAVRFAGGRTRVTLDFHGLDTVDVFLKKLGLTDN